MQRIKAALGTVPQACGHVCRPQPPLVVVTVFDKHVHQLEAPKCSELPSIKLQITQYFSCSCQGLHVQVVMATAAALRA